jgi:hypothetical protein
LFPLLVLTTLGNPDDWPEPQPLDYWPDQSTTFWGSFTPDGQQRITVGVRNGQTIESHLDLFYAYWRRHLITELAREREYSKAVRDAAWALCRRDLQVIHDTYQRMREEFDREWIARNDSPDLLQAD